MPVATAATSSNLRELIPLFRLPRCVPPFCHLTISRTASVPSTQVQLSIFCLYVLRIYGGYYPRLVLGDSHVSWLERFVSSSGIRFGTGSSLKRLGLGRFCLGYFYSVSGLSKCGSASCVTSDCVIFTTSVSKRFSRVCSREQPQPQSQMCK